MSELKRGTSTLGEIVGARLRQIRENEGQTQDGATEALRALGLSWPRSTLAKLERGERGVSLEELVILAAGWDESLAQLVPPEDTEIVLTPRTSIHAGDLFAILQGETSHWNVLDSPRRREIAPPAIERTKEELKRLEKKWPDLHANELKEMNRTSWNEVETKGARSIEVEPVDLAVAAQRLYRRGIREERDERARQRVGPEAASRTWQAVRGHVTHQLLAEIKEEVDAANRRARRRTQRGRK